MVLCKNRQLQKGCGVEEGIVGGDCRAGFVRK